MTALECEDIMYHSLPCLAFCNQLYYLVWNIIRTIRIIFRNNTDDCRVQLLTFLTVMIYKYHIVIPCGLEVNRSISIQALTAINTYSII